eukprot:Awhi_evm1s7202
MKYFALPRLHVLEFRTVILDYASALEKLSISLLDIYAEALGISEDVTMVNIFKDYFRSPLFRLRMTRYPLTGSGSKY